jgi:transposase
MMHCTIEDLLALRDNEGSVWAREHVDSCDVCRTELDAIYQRAARLKALPSLAPARSRWPAIRNQVLASQARRRQRWMASGLAAAALLAGVLVLRPHQVQPAYAQELAQAKRQSATLEAELQSLDPDSRVESGRAAGLAAALEDQIAAVDAQLSGIEEQHGIGQAAVELWRDRVNLMQQLVDVHATNAAYVGL